MFENGARVEVLLERADCDRLRIRGRIDGRVAARRRCSPRPRARPHLCASAYCIAICMTGRRVRRPRLMLMTRAPWSAAQMIPAATFDDTPLPVASSTRTGRMWTPGAAPAMPTAVVHPRRDDPRDMRSVTVRVVAPVVGGVDVVDAGEHDGAEVLVRGVDTGVDDRAPSLRRRASPTTPDSNDVWSSAHCCGRSGSFSPAGRQRAFGDVGLDAEHAARRAAATTFASQSRRGRVPRTTVRSPFGWRTSDQVADRTAGTVVVAGPVVAGPSSRSGRRRRDGSRIRPCSTKGASRTRYETCSRTRSWPRW